MGLLPAKQRQALWDTADQLFPTYSSLHSKIHRMLQDEHDNKLGFAPMDLDNSETESGEWVDTGETFPGKGANGEDVLFTLQRRGSAIRVAPKGSKGRKGKAGSKGGKGENGNDNRTTGKA